MSLEYRDSKILSVSNYQLRSSSYLYIEYPTSKPPPITNNRMLFKTLLLCVFTTLSLAAAVPPSTAALEAAALCDNLCDMSGKSPPPHIILLHN
jgi:hypothetical protein